MTYYTKAGKTTLQLLTLKFPVGQSLNFFSSAIHFLISGLGIPSLHMYSPKYNSHFNLLSPLLYIQWPPHYVYLDVSYAPET